MNVFLCIETVVIVVLVFCFIAYGIYEFCHYEEEMGIICLFLAVILIVTFLIILNSNWTCSNCQTNNSIYRNECKECGYSREKSRDNEKRIDINSVDINCEEVQIHEKESEADHNETVEKWICPDCGNENSGKFCPKCGKEKIIKQNEEKRFCPSCGNENNDRFCPNCGKENKTE